MLIETNVRDGTTIARLAGEFDGVAAPAARDELRRVVAGATRVVLDLSRVSYLSSAALRVLLLIHRDAEAAGTALELRDVPPMIRDIMAATGFLEFFQVADSAVDQDPFDAHAQ